MNKRVIKLILLFLILLLGATLAFAQEVEYPEIPGTEKPTPEGGLPKYIVYFFNLILLLGTLIVAGVLIYGGFSYITAAGNTRRMNKGKTRMVYAFIGLAILFSSYLILNTINPDLIILSLEDLPVIEPRPEPPSPPEPEPEPIEYQEIPIGTLLENIISKNIDCYEKENDTFNHDKMIDCQDHKEIKNGHYEVYDRKGYCYDFDDKGNFLDANPDTEEIDPLTEHDRLECIKKLEKAVEPRMKKLKEWTKELQELTEQCTCDLCINNETCQGNSSCSGDCKRQTGCKGKPYEPGDPCPNRDAIDEVRKKIRRNYKDKELKELSVDKFEELAADTPEHGDKTLLVADQVRYLLVNFLIPLKKDLENDLKYLKKAEDMLKNECSYQGVINHARFFELKTGMENLEKIEFCKTSGARWGESCSKEEQVEITKYCRDFNCKDCYDEDGNKIPCYECNLDELDQGDCSVYEVQGVATTSCKCSEYLLNNEKGEDYELKEGCETEDEKCKICKIENEEDNDTEEKECFEFDDNPITFYCRDPELKISPPGALITNRCTVDPEVKEGYHFGQIPIGEAVDKGELFAKLILEKLKNINKSIKDATDAVFNPERPGKLKEITGDIDVLYTLPLGCMCGPSPDPHWLADHCLSVMVCDCETESTNGDTETHCTCECECQGNPCLDSRIATQVGIVRGAYEGPEGIVESFKKIKYLVNDNEEELKEDDPHRMEIINKYQNSREKLEQCITGFEKVPKPKMTKKRLINCSEALDLIRLEQIMIIPEFPIYGFETCYPYNSDTLLPGDKQSCLQNRDSNQCQRAVEGLMNNYFCCEE